MSPPRTRGTWLPGPSALLLAPLLLMAVPAPTTAQAASDFLLGQPVLTVGVRGGIAQPRQSSDLWSFVQDELTLEQEEFRSAGWGLEVAWRATERLDVAVRLDQSSAEEGSEFREWVDTEDQPIEQRTSFRRRPLTLNVKLFLTDRGREISQFAWVPGGFSPYIGAGAGYVWWRFEQEGDFVDFETLEIFSDKFIAEGAAPYYQVLGGVQATLTPRLVLNAEVNYGWAQGELDQPSNGQSDYIGYEPLDLAGAGVTVGLALRL